MCPSAELAPAPATADPMTPWACRVLHVRRETHDTFTLEIEPPPVFSFAPGQFSMLGLPGIGEVPISISGDPRDRSRLVHTTRAVGVVTGALQRVRRGDLVGVRGPYGSAWPVEEAAQRDVVIVAGGIGLAPLRPAVYALLARRRHHGRVVLLYGARTPRDILYAQQLERWRGRFDIEVEVTVDSAPGDWRGDVGVVTTLLPRARFDARHALAMVCGPELMMRFAATALVERGLPASSTYVSLERSMKCGLGFCGHCQLGPLVLCRDGAVVRLDTVERLLTTREL